MAVAKGVFAREKNPYWKGGRFVTQNGYVKVLDPEHPRSDPRGYVFEHIKVAGEAAGAPVPLRMVVHHVNGIKTDNRPENLRIMTAQEHNALHQREIAFRECGDAEKRKCTFCGRWDFIDNLYVNAKCGNARHRSCYNAYQNAWKARRRA
jgi:hypothetical protein